MKAPFLSTILLLVLGIGLLAAQVPPPEPGCSRAKRARHRPSLRKSPNQSRVDMIYYHLELQIDPAAETVQGQVTARARVETGPLDTLDLDLVQELQVQAVTREGTAIPYRQTDNDLLQILLPQPLATGQTLEVVVKYAGPPPARGGWRAFNFDHYDGKPMIWSLSEPYGAPTWWPCVDDPSDKADSVDITVTVPSELIVASNGVLTGVDSNAVWSTYSWSERYPIATYLVSVAIHPYQVFYDWFPYSPTDSMRLEYYVFPGHYQRLQEAYSPTKSMLAAFSDRFGLYPFIAEKYGHAEFLWGGGMEHQTLTSLGGSREGLIAHELAHQWWGDMVTCANFQHIWLNEGLATYSEALWWEARGGGRPALQANMAGRKYYGPGTIHVQDTSSVGDIFNFNLVYNKAAWVLHMLRHVVGDTAFFNGLREYGQRFQYSSALTGDFQEVMSTAGGRNLEPFFEQWIYGSGYPQYVVGWLQEGDSLLVQMRQIQTGNLFSLPIDLQITCDDTSFIQVVENEGPLQSFLIPLPAGQTVTDLVLDPGDWILKTVQYSPTVAVDTSLPVPAGFQLYPAYPNPFNSRVTIPYYVPRAGRVQVMIYDLSGQRIWSAGRNHGAQGTYRVAWPGTDWNGRAAPSGVYLLRVRAQGIARSGKLVLLR